MSGQVVVNDTANDMQVSIAYTNVALLSQYELLKDAYYGTGGFKDGRYLVPHIRTDIDQFRDMKAQAFYSNYLKPVLNSHISPIFGQDAERSWDEAYEDEPILNGFLNDADGMGHSLQRVVKWNARLAKLYAVSFALVDNWAFPAENKLDAVEARSYPFVISIPASAVCGWELDAIGRFNRFTYAEINEGEKRYKTWTRSEWFISTSEGKKKQGEPSGKNALGYVPIASLYSFDREDLFDVLPLSEFYSLARVNHRVYNIDAEITELARSQAYSILFYPGNPASLAGGTRSAIGFDGSLSHAPFFASPDAAQLKGLMEERAELVGEIYRQANLTHLHSGESAAASGIAKQYDLEITSQALRDFTLNIEQFEDRIVKIFGDYRAINYGYSVEYSRNYAIQDPMAVLLQNGEALNQDFGARGNAEVKKRSAAVLFPDTETLTAVEESIDLQAADEALGSALDKAAGAADGAEGDGDNEDGGTGAGENEGAERHAQG